MINSGIERLREGYEGKYVTVENGREELARFEGLVGRVATVTCNGRALVEFNAGADRSRYDIEIDHLKVVARPGDKSPGDKSPGNGAEQPVDKEKSPPAELSPLEVARLEKETQ